MARGITTSVREMFVRGGTNNILGTNDDDYINVQRNMNAYQQATNLIDVANGNDTVIVGGAMTGYGSNTIKGANGNKNISVAGGMDGYYGAHNTVEVGDGNHTIAIGNVRSFRGGENVVHTGNGTDRVTFSNLLYAGTNGRNVVELGDGTKYLNINNGLTATDRGANEISLGLGRHEIAINREVLASYNASNRISSTGGDSVINIKGMMRSDGVNEISLGTGTHDISIGGLYATTRGTNTIETAGTTKLTFTGQVTSYFMNEIFTGNGDDTITFNRGLYAYNSGVNHIDTGDGDDKVVINNGLVASCTNHINTGAGDDHVIISGKIYSSQKAGNIVETGAGNDTIELNGTVNINGLTLNAGDGYDTLVLSARNYYQFNSQYKNWLSSGQNLASSDIEAIQVDIDQRFTLNSVDWLTKLVNTHNAQNPTSKIDVEINLDSYASLFSLDNVFTAADESAIGVIDLSGNHANGLVIRSSLASNGYDNDVLRINGDANDIVGLDLGWTNTNTTVTHESGIEYHVFSNQYQEDVLVQVGMGITYV